MVKPNQIVRFEPEKNEVTFLMFAMTEEMVKRRVLFLNFPSTIRDVMFSDKEVDDYIANVQLASKGMVNRYTVTIDTGVVFN